MGNPVIKNPENYNKAKDFQSVVQIYIPSAVETKGTHAVHYGCDDAALRIAQHLMSTIGL